MSEDRHIRLAHGNGGRLMRELVRDVFARQFGDAMLDARSDAALVRPPSGDLLTTTDGFSVQPLEFPGGDIGSLCVHGVVNDLAVCGARPFAMTLSFFIEEGFERARLERIVASLGSAARACGVAVIAGDTKVVPRGQGGGLYISASGLGARRAGLRLAIDRVRAGDRVLVSGPVGDHGAAVLLAREEFGLSGDLRSDAASVLPLTTALLDLPGLRFMRDPTRGGLATVAHEIVEATGLTARLNEIAIPVRESVRFICDMLGYEPLYLACEGRVVAVVAPQEAEEALARWRALPDGRHAAIIGDFQIGERRCILATELGGERIVNELEDDPLPRIC